MGGLHLGMLRSIEGGTGLRYRKIARASTLSLLCGFGALLVSAIGSNDLA